ncbi:ribosomal protection-like ABC-F family protein [Niallia sp. Sow4_A1]|jgi:macrolide transport system ATP-binding/permease protein|uniref:Ribosome protection protein VmlR n=1 Tax=Niallia hominis TaxID=3133173 RepID=A0ABV1EYT8_9BACI|nr:MULTISPECIES: ABC-F type ribosomal protection protein [Bacillaceae]MCF2647811.1 ABC-F type ribosomal protection protein [Niallia circulans]MCM3362297.1 ABC-F type ribosomal protection protein [Niallia sp. MER TA 168]
MTELFKLVNISYEVLDATIFEKINASVRQGEVIGIIGKNGAGKSTLLQLINQDIAPTNGHLKWIKENLVIRMVEQETENYDLAEENSTEMKLLEKWQVPTNDFQNMSGGEKLKARLARGFAVEADILLLDEPTNHLDERSMKLLQQQIKKYKGTILLVSHDRYFLDSVTTKIWSIESRKLIEHKGNYSSYMEAREQKRLTQQREYDKQQKKIKQVEGQMKEITSWAQKAHAQSTKQEFPKEYYRAKAKRMDAQVKSKQKRLEKELERNKVERVEEEYTVSFSIEANKKKGKRFLEIKDLSKKFGSRVLFEKGNITIQYGEKVAIIGPNGSGKTTLLNIILGKEKADGEAWISPTANMGYLTQEVFDLPLEETPEQLFFTETFAARGKVQTLMKHLGFMPSQWKEPIKNMSMGERVKCKLMAYILEEKDVLILDEPTNHLDLPSREQLEETLSQYNGTLLIVSHDRYFLEKTTTSKIVLAEGFLKRQWTESEKQERDNKEELRLKLETERQEVLGKLSFMTPKDKKYAELDRKFLDLTKRMKELE